MPSGSLFLEENKGKVLQVLMLEGVKRNEWSEKASRGLPLLNLERNCRYDVCLVDRVVRAEAEKEPCWAGK